MPAKPIPATKPSRAAFWWCFGLTLCAAPFPFGWILLIVIVLFAVVKLTSRDTYDKTLGSQALQGAGIAFLIALFLLILFK